MILVCFPLRAKISLITIMRQYRYEKTFGDTPAQGSQKINLTNGIPVVFEQFDGPVASLYWWVKVGSCDENKGEEGFAHFLEHMHFKDTTAKETGRPSTGKLAQEVEAMGGEINAYTSFDMTVYHITCAETHLEKIIKAFSSLSKPQSFLNEDFRREKEVIIEEMKRSNDSPGRRMFQTLFSTAYTKHPYSRPVIGFDKSIRNSRLAALQSFYRRQYVSAKMGVSLVGPFVNDKNRFEKIKKTVEKYFGSAVIPARKASNRVRSFDPIFQKGSTSEVIKFDVKNPSVCMSFRVPELSHEDIPALDVAAAILGMGESGRLYQKLFSQDGLVLDVSASLYSPGDPGIAYLSADVDESDKIPKALDSIRSEIDKLIHQGVREEEIKKVIKNIESERVFSSQTADGLASRLGYLEFVLGDPHYDSKYENLLKTVNSDKIVAVVKKYFVQETLSCVVMLPETDSVQKVEFDVNRVLKEFPQFEALRPSAPKKKNQKPFEEYELENGLRVVARHRPNTGVFAITAVCLGGTRFESQLELSSADSLGAAHLMSDSWDKGAGDMSAAEIAEFLESRAASVRGFSGKNATGLEASGLAGDWADVTKVFSKILTQPKFPEAEVEHSRRITLESIRSVADQTSSLCGKLFQESMFQTHPYGKWLYGEEGSISKFTPEDLRKVHLSLVRPERLVLAVSGAIPPEQVKEFALNLSFLFTSDLKPISFSNPDEEKNILGPRWVEKPMGREQVHLMTGVLGDNMYSKNRDVIRIAQTILGGQGGRLFLELREKRSLAYTVAPTFFEGIERGSLAVYMASAPEKREEATKGIDQVMETLAKKGPRERELKRAQELYLGRRAMELQNDQAFSICDSLQQIYGLPYLTQQDAARAIRKVTTEGVKKFLRDQWVNQSRVTTIVG